MAARLTRAVAGLPRPSPSTLRLSVIIPSHDRASLLRCAAVSALDQYYPPTEVIVVDDGSSQDLTAALAGLPVRVLRQERRGAGAARNLGARAATGDYLLFLDSDDLFFPWSLAAYAVALEAEGRPAIAMVPPTLFRDPLELCHLALKTPVWRGWRDYLAAAEASLRVSVAAAVWRETFLMVGGFDEQDRSSEDQDLWLRLGEASGFIYLMSPTVYAYRQHDGGVTFNAQRLHEGVRRLLQAEAVGAYPGGAARAGARARLLARNVRFGVRKLNARNAPWLALDLLRRGSGTLRRGGLGGNLWPLARMTARRMGLVGARALRRHLNSG